MLVDLPETGRAGDEYPALFLQGQFLQYRREAEALNRGDVQWYASQGGAHLAALEEHVYPEAGDAFVVVGDVRLKLLSEAVDRLFRHQTEELALNVRLGYGRVGVVRDEVARDSVEWRTADLEVEVAGVLLDGLPQKLMQVHTHFPCLIVSFRHVAARGSRGGQPAVRPCAILNYPL